MADTVVNRAESERVRRALAQLNDRQRQVLERIYYRGYTQAQTAALLAMPLGTVHSRAREALRRLGTELGVIPPRPAPANPGGAGPRPVGVSADDAVMGEPTVDARLAETFVELADTLVANFDVVEFLHTLTERCVALLDVHAAGLLLADGRGALRLVAASTSRAEVLELFQLQQEEGPCLEGYRTGQVVALPDLTKAEHAQQWPRFTTAAGEAGFAAVHAIPMRLREDTIGTLNLFRTHPGGLDDTTARVGQALVDVATISVLQERAVHHHEMVTEQLQTALNSRSAIEQAKGILAERHHLTPEQAFTALRRYARSHNQRLADLASQIIDDSTAAPVAQPHTRKQP